MQKKIALFIGEISWNYQESITKFITQKANALGYDVLVFCSYGYYYEKHLLYSEGEKAGIHIPDLSMFDGIIVTEDVFDIEGMGDELAELFKQHTTCPIIYLRTYREGFYSVLLEDRVSIANMTRHFTDVHGFRDICYMSGKAGTTDAADRLQGFLDVMEENNIPVTEHMIFQGDYWRNKGEEAVDWFMEGRTTYPQAIICANDYMALSICEELRKRKVRIPEDVCVSGFDFIDESKTYEPTLTSLEIDLEMMANEAISIIQDVNHGKQTDYIKRLPAKMCIHKSCGCGEQYHFTDVVKIQDTNHHHISDTKNILLATVDYQDAFELDEYMAVAERYQRFIRADKSYFCFNDESEQGSGEVENASSFTNQVILRRIFDTNGPTQILETRFPRKNVLPDECWSDTEPRSYCVFTMHFNNIVYGYMATSVPTNGWFDIYTQGYLMTLASAIANGNIHKQMEHLEEIRSLYQKDPLTGILNRRGFDKLLQDNLVSARLAGINFGLVSIDMDNLKHINDNFGHAEGDRAITALARALDSVMKPKDFCARIGGDEFSAFIYLPGPNSATEFRNAFYIALEKESSYFSEYELGASIGICEIAEDPEASLMSCIQVADMRMYEDKRFRKSHKQKPIKR